MRLIDAEYLKNVLSSGSGTVLENALLRIIEETPTAQELDKRPTLEQLLDILIKSDRIVIYDGEENNSPELYRGWVGCFEYAKSGIDTKRRVVKTGIGSEIFKIERQQKNKFFQTKELGEEIPAGSVNDFEFSDLKQIIYTRIFLEV